jgi:hypothetical protein
MPSVGIPRDLKPTEIDECIGLLLTAEMIGNANRTWSQQLASDSKILSLRNSASMQCQVGIVAT